MKINLIKIMTINAWFLTVPFFRWIKISASYNKRLRFMAEKIAAKGTDIICLQEVWHNSARVKLINDFNRLGYKYYAFKKGVKFYELISRSRQRVVNSFKIPIR